MRLSHDTSMGNETLADEDQPTDISPGHFATRQTDRGPAGALVRLFDTLNEAGKTELLRYAAELVAAHKAAGGAG